MEKFLLDPKAPGAFSSDVMHKVVLTRIADVWFYNPLIFFAFFFLL